MSASTYSAPQMTKAGLWTARAIGALTVLFLLFDAVGKLVRPQPVVDAFARLGMPIGFASAIGVILGVLVIAYVIPKTRVFGAILLTGFLGGAVAVQFRAGSSAFETLFPIIMGILAWTPIYMTDDRVRALIPLRR